MGSWYYRKDGESNKIYRQEETIVLTVVVLLTSHIHRPTKEMHVLKTMLPMGRPRYRWTDDDVKNMEEIKCSFGLKIH